MAKMWSASWGLRTSRCAVLAESVLLGVNSGAHPVSRDSEAGSHPPCWCPEIGIRPSRCHAASGLYGFLINIIRTLRTGHRREVARGGHLTGRAPRGGVHAGAGACARQQRSRRGHDRGVLRPAGIPSPAACRRSCRSVCTALEPRPTAWPCHVRGVC